MKNCGSSWLFARRLYYINPRGHNSRTDCNADLLLRLEIKPHSVSFMFNLSPNTYAGLHETTSSGDSNF